jgi:hypothetical protein
MESEKKNKPNSEELLKELLEKAENLGEEEQQTLRRKLTKKLKFLEIEPQTYQTIYQVVKEVYQYLEKNKPEGMEDVKSDSELEIGLNLYCSEKKNLVKKTTKILQIYWKDKEQLKKFRTKIV